MEQTIDNHLSPRQVARAIGVSESSLKRWCDKGLIPTVKTAGGHRRMPVSAVVQFLRENGYPLVDAKALGLPDRTGRGSLATPEALRRVREALQIGDEERLRRTVLDLYLGGVDGLRICDGVLAEAFHELGQAWQHGDVEIYQERRGVEITMRLLRELIAMQPEAAADAPRALGGTLSHDHYSLPATMVELVLREVGWRAENLGCGLPGPTLESALRQQKPDLLWLSVSHVASVENFLDHYRPLQQAAEELGTAVVLGGRALAEDLRRQIRYTAYCDNLEHVVSFARAFRRA